MSDIVVSIHNADIFQGDNLVLQNVNFNITRGEFVYLVGKTGTGKSSLLKTLYGELTLTKGEASVVGFDLRTMDWKKVPFLRRNLGVIFQDFQLLTDRNVQENLRFGLKATGWQGERLMEEKINDVLNIRLLGFTTVLCTSSINSVISICTSSINSVISKC